MPSAVMPDLHHSAIFGLEPERDRLIDKHSLDFISTAIEAHCSVLLYFPFGLKQE